MSQDNCLKTELFDLYRGILAMSGELGGGATGEACLYLNRAPEFYEELLVKYPVEEAAGNGSALDKALNLLRWVYANNYHRDSNGGLQEYNALTVFEQSFGKGKENGLNCACLAAALTDCLQAVGVKTRAIACFPYNPYDCDNHVIALPYIPELKKWIMLDPSTCAWLTDADGNILAPWELRTALLERHQVQCNPEVSWDHKYDEPFEKLQQDYLRYMAKDSYFYCECNFGTKTMLLPQGFDYNDFMIRKLKYMMQEFNDNPFDAEACERFKKRPPVNSVSFADFTAAPE